MRRTDYLPSRPLGEAVLRLVERERSNRNPFAFDVTDVETRCASRGVMERLGVSERNVFAWSHGEREGVEFATADRLLQHADWLWWDVWNEDTLRLPVLTARRYGLRSRLAGRAGGRELRRTLIGVRSYGDRGPDLPALARVRHVFECSCARDFERCRCGAAGVGREAMAA